MAEVWVTNASPLITLASIGQLRLFPALGTEVHVPLKVLGEVDAGAAGDRADESVRASGQFVIIPDIPVPLEVERWELDPGEEQVISQALAVEGRGSLWTTSRADAALKRWVSMWWAPSA